MWERWTKYASDGRKSYHKGTTQSNRLVGETSSKCELRVQTLRFLVQRTGVRFTAVRSFRANFIIFQGSLGIFSICFCCL